MNRIAMSATYRVEISKHFQVERLSVQEMQKDG